MFLFAGINKAISQRLNIGVEFGSFFGTTTKTVFEDEPFYYLYAAPYSEVDVFGNPANNYFEQVRLVRIWGVSPMLDGNISFGGNVNYQSKNRFRLSFALNFHNTTDEVFYSFQNLMINMDENSGFSISETELIQDESIKISKFINTYSLILSYDIYKKSKIKPFLSAGFTERIQLHSSYTSYITEYIGNKDENFYQNIKKFQDDLYREMQDDGFSHYASLGFGLRYHSLELEVMWNMTVGNIQSEYYQKQQYWTLNLSYDIVSIPLFK